jgi:molybdopterin molybdotransferase
MIYDSNSHSLAAQLRETGAEPLLLGGVADNAGATVQAIAAGLEKCDVLILSGGVSAGDFDFVPAAMKGAGFTLHFEKIAVQPGMPTVFASRGEKAAFGLPGNPVSTFVIFEVFIKPLLLRQLGHGHQPLLQPVVLAAAFHRSRAERTVFLPVFVSFGRAELVSYHGSAHLHALSRANALLRVEAGCSAIAAGSTVDVRFL